MSADGKQADLALEVAVLIGLLGLSGVVVADDEVTPDIEFLEYLGSWEESDEDWVVLAAEAAERGKAETKRTGPAAKGKEPVETDDES